MRGLTPHHFYSGGLRRTTFVYKSGAGFTLIEMVAVFAIIGLLGGVVFVGGRTADRSLALDRAAQQVAQDIRRGGELAFGAELFTCAGGPALFSGYGIYFTASAPSQYILYANCNGVDSEGYRSNPPDPDEIVETFFFDPSVEIGDVDDGGTGDEWSVAFFPPEPRIALCTADSCTTSLTAASLTLRSKSDTSNT